MSDYMFDLSNYYVNNIAGTDKTATKSTNQKAGSDLGFDDYLSLMVATLQNQSIDDTASTSEMMSQMIQVSMIQAISSISDMVSQTSGLTYAASLVGKEVTIGETVGSQVKEVRGTVTGTGVKDGEQVIFIGDDIYSMSSILAVGQLPGSGTAASGNAGTDTAAQASGTNAAAQASDTTAAEAAQEAAAAARAAAEAAQAAAAAMENGAGTSGAEAVEAPGSAASGTEAVEAPGAAASGTEAVEASGAGAVEASGAEESTEAAAGAAESGTAADAVEASEGQEEAAAETVAASEDGAAVNEDEIPAEAYQEALEEMSV